MNLNAPCPGVQFFLENPNPDFWHSQSELFFGKRFEKSIFDKQFLRTKKHDILTEPMYVGSALTLNNYFHIIPCLSSIYIRTLFLNPYLSCFLYRVYVVSA